MTSDPPDQTRTAVLGAAAIVLIAGGWFLLSWRVAHNPAGDAFDESLGVAFAVLIVVALTHSFVRRNRTTDADEQQPGAEGQQGG
jgi:hypothetical protein